MVIRIMASKEYTCPGCGGELKVIEIPTKLYECSSCNAAFKESALEKFHREAHHGENNLD